MKRLRVGVALVLVASNAYAQPTDEDKATALTLFRRGRELMDARRIDEACASFAESERLDPGGGTLLNLAVCHEEQGKTATAWAELSDALAMARRDGREDRIALAREHMTALEPRLSRLVIVPPNGVEIRVTRNGSEVPRVALGIPIPVDPGHQIVEAYVGTTSVFRTEIDVRPNGDRARVEIAVAETPRPMPSESRSGVRKILGWTLVGAGAVSIGAGGFFGLRALDERGASDDGCRGDRCSNDAVDHNDRAKTFADVSTTTIGMGAVAVVAGVVLLLLDR